LEKLLLLVFNVHGVNGDKQKEMYAAEPLIRDAGSFEHVMNVRIPYKDGIFLTS
jgi:hypothetical protein